MGLKTQPKYKSVWAQPMKTRNNRKTQGKAITYGPPQSPTHLVTTRLPNCPEDHTQNSLHGPCRIQSIYSLIRKVEAHPSPAQLFISCNTNSQTHAKTMVLTELLISEMLYKLGSSKLFSVWDLKAGPSLFAYKAWPLVRLSNKALGSGLDQLHSLVCASWSKRFVSQIAHHSRMQVHENSIQTVQNMAHKMDKNVEKEDVKIKIRS